jgi:hypothetical protein
MLIIDVYKHEISRIVSNANLVSVDAMDFVHIGVWLALDNL